MPRFTELFALGLFVGGWFSVASPLAAQTRTPMIEARLATGVVEGSPIWWSDRAMNLLARDGRMMPLRIDAIQNFRQTAPRFRGFSASELRAQLYAEFGNEFEVTSTGHYLVVHPRGQQSQWAERFEKLYRAFSHYFQVRGFRLQEPEFPLVAVVFRNQADYARYAAKIGEPVAPDFLGHYSNQSNRIYLFDTTAGATGGDWSQNAATIIHEATHQTAFNTGVHGRFNSAPRWLAEGLAMMFEAPGVWQGNSNSTQRARINEGRLRDFRQQLAQGRRPRALTELIAGDDLFARDPHVAYANAWALSFYLAETRPSEYARYLQRTAARPPFERYDSAARLEDFAAELGRDLVQLDAELVRYIERLK